MPALNALRVDEIPRGTLQSLACPGVLGMTLLPGKRGTSPWSGTVHARDLDRDLDDLKALYGTGVLVSLIEPHEYGTWGLTSEHAYREALAARGFALLGLPVPDMGTPNQDQLDAWHALVQDVAARLRRGEAVIVHCLGGLGRTGMLVATVLARLGLAPEEAMGATRSARPGTIQTRAQERVIHDTPGRHA